MNQIDNFLSSTAFDFRSLQPLSSVILFVTSLVTDRLYYMYEKNEFSGGGRRGGDSFLEALPLALFF